jgi:hypothetical protein
MTLVNQEMILEYARTMGDFTTKQMATIVYGDVDHGHTSAAHKKLTKLVKHGDIIRVGRRKDGAQWQTVWRAVL